MGDDDLNRGEQGPPPVPTTTERLDSLEAAMGRTMGNVQQINRDLTRWDTLTGTQNSAATDLERRVAELEEIKGRLMRGEFRGGGRRKKYKTRKTRKTRETRETRKTRKTRKRRSRR